MKTLLFTILTVLAISGYCQNADNEHQKCLDQLEKTKARASSNIFIKWAEPNPLQRGHAYSACDGWPGAGFKCRAHHLQCCYKGCNQNYAAEITKLENIYKQNMAACDAKYERDKYAEKNSIKAQLEREKQRKEEAIKSIQAQGRISSPPVSAAPDSKEKNTNDAAAVYGFVTYSYDADEDHNDPNAGLKGVLYVSDVIDYTKLSCDLTGFPSSGKFDKLEFCAMKWFAGLLQKKLGIKASMFWMGPLQRWFLNEKMDGKSIAGITNDMVMHSRTEAENKRKKIMHDAVANRWGVFNTVTRTVEVSSN